MNFGVTFSQTVEGLCFPQPQNFPVSFLIVLASSFPQQEAISHHFSRDVSESKQGHVIYTFVASRAYLQSIKVSIFVRWLKRYRKLCLLCMLNNPNTLR